MWVLSVENIVIFCAATIYFIFSIVVILLFHFININYTSLLFALNIVKYFPQFTYFFYFEWH